MVALLFAGSAILLYSCGREQEQEETASQDETVMTEYGENLTVLKSENGQKSYRFKTPLMETYGLAKDPYREFRKGVKIVTFKADSVSTVDATLTANYAIYYEKRDLWEAKGNVVVRAAGGERTLYTQQLFWNAKTKRIYSNVDSKFETKNGRDVYYVEGFESDDQMKDWRGRRILGQMEFEMRNQADSTGMNNEGASGSDSAAAVPARSASTGKAAPSPREPASIWGDAPQKSRPQGNADRMKRAPDDNPSARSNMGQKEKQTVPSRQTNADKQ